MGWVLLDGKECACPVADILAAWDAREAADLDQIAARVVAMCKKRGWSLHWTHRGAYLHLEASELIEAVRGKGDSTPVDEAGDVLLVLMSIVEHEGVPFTNVVSAAARKLTYLESAPPYEGEERAALKDTTP